MINDIILGISRYCDTYNKIRCLSSLTKQFSLKDRFPKSDFGDALISSASILGGGKAGEYIGGNSNILGKRFGGGHFTTADKVLGRLAGGYGANEATGAFLNKRLGRGKESKIALVTQLSNLGGRGLTKLILDSYGSKLSKDNKDMLKALGGAGVSLASNYALRKYYNKGTNKNYTPSYGQEDYD
jgi:hypothetical protein